MHLTAALLSVLAQVVFVVEIVQFISEVSSPVQVTCVREGERVCRLRDEVDMDRGRAPVEGVCECVCECVCVCVCVCLHVCA